MKLEDQVCSLALSQRLKELGVKQESTFSWYVFDRTGEISLLLGYGGKTNRSEMWCAFTVAELEKILPQGVNIAYKNGKPRETNHHRLMRCVHNGYSVSYRHPNYNSDSWIEGRSETFADAFALILIYLLENKLITI